MHVCLVPDKDCVGAFLLGTVDILYRLQGICKLGIRHRLCLLQIDVCWVLYTDCTVACLLGTKHRLYWCIFVGNWTLICTGYMVHVCWVQTQIVLLNGLVM